MNVTADWIASNAAGHSGEILWMHMGTALVPLRDILSFDIFGYIYTRLVLVLHLIKKEKRKMLLFQSH